MQDFEKNKYEMMWLRPEYRWNSPGLNAASDFLNYFQESIEKGHSIIDFGCGTGRASAVFL